MRIGIIGKFPPIQGGVSRDTLWDAHILSSEGHDVHLITNAHEVEAPYRIRFEPYAAHPVPDPRAESAIHIHSTITEPDLINHIPLANPYVGKLAGLVVRANENTPFDLLYGYYLEPYGIAACLASAHLKVPFGLRHAGSDIARLYRHHGLHEIYRETARSADFWIAPSLTRRGLQHLGISDDIIYSTGPHSLNTEYFNPTAPPLAIDSISTDLGSNESEIRDDRPVQGTFDAGLPTIGMYGKAGPNKGFEEMFHAAAAARNLGLRFNLVVVASGPSQRIRDLRRAAEQLNICDRVTFLPFMPPWIIPSFITACDAVAFLEHDFPIAIHRPIVPREVLACAGCLILSRDVASYQPYSEKLSHGNNCLLVDMANSDELVDALTVVIKDRDVARQIGRAGHHEISQDLEDWPRYKRYVQKNFEQIDADLRFRSLQVTMAETQAALARLYVDDAFRAWYAHAPADALSKYELTADERLAIESIDQKMLGIFAETLREKRRERIASAYPLAAEICGTWLDRYFDRYYDLHPARPGEKTVDHILDFGKFLVESVVSNPDLPEYVGDLCRYELAINRVRLTPLDEDDLFLINALTEARQEDYVGDGVRDDARPAVGPGVTVMTFSFDIPTIADAIVDSSRPAAFDRKTTHVILRATRNAAPTPFRINTATAALLTRCTGQNSLLQIHKGLQTDLGNESLTIEGVRRALLKLHGNGLIHFEFGTDRRSDAGE